jgi:mRNA interferase RelE/StbE
MRYEIVYEEQVSRTDIPHLPPNVKKVIKIAIENKLTVDPISFGKPLRYSLKRHRRLRVGDYRVVFRVEQSTSTVIVVAIKHRKDIYDS